MLGIKRLHLPQPPTHKPVREYLVTNAFGKWMYERGWYGFTLPLPYVTLILYWFANPDPLMRVHEFAHVRQAQQLGAVRFWFLYLAAVVRYGYFENKYEVEAREDTADAALFGIPTWADDGSYGETHDANSQAH